MTTLLPGSPRRRGQRGQMNTSIEGFYAGYLTGSATQGFSMFIFREGTITGADAGGISYDGTYKLTDAGIAVDLSFSIPPNTLLIQGVSTGQTVEKLKLEFVLPLNFASLPFIRIDANHGPINAKLVKLRDLQ